MHRKTYRGEENHSTNKPRKTHKNMPSFSSTLLDEIYRSIDGNVEDMKSLKEKRQNGSRVKASSIEDEEIASFRRACLVEKWMEKEINEKALARRRHHPSLFQEVETKSLQDNDLVFFSSTSSSSDSSGQLSSSDTEFFGPNVKPKVSCFSTRPKPVRTRETNRKEEPFLIEDDLIKSKSRALKIYSNLKKMKQPISPGGRLTSFINSILNNVNGKKSKNLETKKQAIQDLKSSPKATSSSTCSSASSFSRSCLSKYSPRSREKMRNGVQRTVRFNPVSVIVDEDSRPCGHKSIYEEDPFVNKFGRPPLPPNTLQQLKLSRREENRSFEQVHNQRKDDFSRFRKMEYEEEEDDEDAMSDSSSDLFEIDHLALFGNSRFCEELPVYETTHLDTNRAIASGLIR